MRNTETYYIYTIFQSARQCTMQGLTLYYFSVYSSELCCDQLKDYTAHVYGGLRGVCRFSLQYLWKRAVRITEKPYTYSSKGKIVYVVGKPCHIYRLRGKPYDNYRISLQSLNITGFPHNIHNLSL